jgi:hypothetical protein
MTARVCGRIILGQATMTGDEANAPKSPFPKLTWLPYWVQLAFVVVIVSYLTGFLIGLGVHRDGREVSEFVMKNLTPEIGDGSAMIVFRCGDNEKLVAYDLLADAILINRDAIESRKNSPLMSFTQSELFASAVGFSMASLSVAYNFKAEVGLIAAGESSLRRVALVLTLAIPSIYLGYSSSDRFKLECGSDKLYDYLNKPENWRPHQFSALKNLFNSVEPCIPRKVTLDIWRGPDQADYDFWIKLLTQKFEGFPAPGGPSENDIAALKAKLLGVPRPAYAQPINMNEVVWGDSIFMRLFGDMKGFTMADPKIDAVDFRSLIVQARACRQRQKELANAKSSFDAIPYLYEKVKYNSHSSADIISSREYRFSYTWARSALRTMPIN